MFHNSQDIAVKLYEILDDLTLTDDKGKISIDKLLNPGQKYDLVMSILIGLPRTNFQKVLELDENFGTPRENTHVIQDFEYKEQRFKLILERAIELGFSLGYTNISLYNTFIHIFNDVEKREIPHNLEKVLEILIDTLFTTYTTIDVLNLTDTVYEAVEELYDSKMTKLIPNEEASMSTLRKSVKILQGKGVEVVTKNLGNNNLMYDRITGKEVNPVTYISPNLKTIINKHLKTLNK